MNRSNAQPQDQADNPPPNPIARVGRIVAVTGAHAIILLDAEERTNVDRRKKPGNRHAAQGRFATVDRPGAGFGPEFAHAVARQGRAGTAHRRGGVHRRTAQGRAWPAKGIPARHFLLIPRSATRCSAPARSELSKAYACDTETSIRIGHIQQDPSIPAMVKIDEMLGKHFAVLGTTGTGKSCTVALILRRILEKNPAGPYPAARCAPRICPVLPGHMRRSSRPTT